MTSRMTIEELAAASGMTVRNIREHQTRGLLSPPAVVGRKGFYDERHLSRLRLIQQLQDEGLNLQAIHWLFQRVPAAGPDEVSRFKHALFTPWIEEQPVDYTSRELVDLLGPTTPDVAHRAEQMGLLQPAGENRWEVPSPRLLGVVHELRELDIPIDVALDVVETLEAHAGAIADAWVDLFSDRVWGPADPDVARTPEEWGRVRDALERLRPVAIDSLLTVFGRAMTAAVAERATQLHRRRTALEPGQTPDHLPPDHLPPVDLPS
jgi:DNA-binding transcriptional MerR regulator